MSEKLDFKAKKYGYGWTPVTPRGWLVTLAFIMMAVAYVTLVVGPHDESIGAGQLFALIVGLSAILSMFVYITMLTGPKARWQWGEKKKK